MNYYSEVKVYNDGSHFIGIPYQPQPWKKRKKIVKSNELDNTKENKENCNVKEIFETLYKENVNVSKKEKNEIVKKELEKYFDSEENLNEFINRENERIKRNEIERKKRFARKVRLQKWHYFCTFTYDSNKLTEEDFRVKLLNCFKHMSNRKGWKYAGVFERSPENNRLHFHGLFYIPEMIGTLSEKRDYSTKNHRMQTTMQNSYFTERFGRNDFSAICDDYFLNQSVKYIMKYIGKTNERIIYSKNLPTYIQTDIMEEDIVCPFGHEERKFILFDNFNLWEDGCLIGQVCEETIKLMPKVN